MMRSLLLGLFVLGGGIPQTILSNTLIIESAFGQNVELHVEENDRFFDVLSQIQAYFQEELPEDQREESLEKPLNGIGVQHARWSLECSHAGWVVRAKKTQRRNYEQPATKEEKNIIARIVRTLAYDSALSIGKQKSSLEESGDKIDHLHPFHFLLTIFLDEELKAGIAAIRGRISWIKNGFFAGITGSLKEEGARKNLLPFVEDFAEMLKVDSRSITPFLEKGQWKEFVNWLIDNIPRENDPNRYNM